MRPRGVHPIVPIAITILVISAATYGLTADSAYRLVTPLLAQTWRAQDAVNLLCLPVMWWAVTGRRRTSVPAHLLVTGVFMWLAYGYAHLAIGTPMNSMFLAYVAVLSVAAYGTLDGLVRVNVEAVAAEFRSAPMKSAAVFLGVAGIGIAVLWLSDIVLSLTGGTPANLHLSGLPNPTWVLDLAWLIPMALAAAVMLWRGHPAGPLVGGVLLVMLLILSAGMLATTPFALAAGLGGDPAVAPQLLVFTVVFGVLGAVELSLVLQAVRRRAAPSSGWRRRGWWSTGVR
jgi:hypothetical protein